MNARKVALISVVAAVVVGLHVALVAGITHLLTTASEPREERVAAAPAAARDGNGGGPVAEAPRPDGVDFGGIVGPGAGDIDLRDIGLPGAFEPGFGGGAAKPLAKEDLKKVRGAMSSFGFSRSRL